MTQMGNGKWEININCSPLTKKKDGLDKKKREHSGGGRHTRKTSGVAIEKVCG